MRDDDVADREPGDVGADFEHLAERRVARVDLAAAGLGDVDGVGERRVVDVVLGRDGEHLEPHVVGADVAQLELVERNDVGDVHVVGVAGAALFGSDGVSGDGVGANGLSHRRQTTGQ